MVKEFARWTGKDVQVKKLAKGSEFTLCETTFETGEMVRSYAQKTRAGKSLDVSLAARAAVQKLRLRRTTQKVRKERGIAVAVIVFPWTGKLPDIAAFRELSTGTLYDPKDAMAATIRDRGAIE